MKQVNNKQVTNANYGYRGNENFVAPALLVLGRVVLVKLIHLPYMTHFLCLHKILQDQIIVAEKSDLKRLNQTYFLPNKFRINPCLLCALQSTVFVAESIPSLRLSDGELVVGDQIVRSFKESLEINKLNQLPLGPVNCVSLRAFGCWGLPCKPVPSPPNLREARFGAELCLSLGLRSWQRGGCCSAGQFWEL